jgi:hydrogenase maturation protease
MGRLPATSYQVEKRYLKKNRETLWCDLTATLLRNQKGEVVYSLVMLENIIERKRAKLLEEERHHVAYELHDGLAQVAVSAHQHLQAFANHYHPRSPQAKLELNRALDLAQRSVREARRLIAGLRPTALDDFGLATALRLQVEAQRADGWSILFEESLGPERLPPTIETTLFSIAQEALTNVRKHAQTLRVRLTLERRDSKIRLEVQDWGRGFARDILLREFCPGEHVGIRAMQERVELAFTLLDDYDTLVLVDAVPRGGVPGTVYLIEPDLSGIGPAQGVEAGRVAVDSHSMDPVKVLAFARTLGARPIRTLLVGCEPATIGGGEAHEEMQMGLSEPVQAAVDEAVKMIDSLVEELVAVNS